jgi:hypothetical protein
VSTLCFGDAQRQAGIAQQIIPGGILRTSGGKPYRCLYHEVGRTDGKWLSEGGDHQARNLLDVKLWAGTGQEHPELVTSNPSEGIGALQDRLEPLRNQYEELVSGRMAIKVVHPLEVVDVYQQHRKASAGALPLLDRVVQVLAEQRTVGETGETVMEGLVMQLNGTLFYPALELAAEGQVIEKDEELAGRHRQHHGAKAEFGDLIERVMHIDLPGSRQGYADEREVGPYES